MIRCQQEIEQVDGRVLEKVHAFCGVDKKGRYFCKKWVLWIGWYCKKKTRVSCHLQFGWMNRKEEEERKIDVFLNIILNIQWSRNSSNFNERSYFWQANGRSRDSQVKPGHSCTKTTTEKIETFELWCQPEICVSPHPGNGTWENLRKYFENMKEYEVRYLWKWMYGKKSGRSPMFTIYSCA